MGTLRTPEEIARRVAEDMAARAGQIEDPQELIKMVLDSASTIGLTMGNPVTQKDVRDLADFCHFVGDELEKLAKGMAPKRTRKRPVPKRARRVPRARA